MCFSVCGLDGLFCLVSFAFSVFFCFILMLPGMFLLFYATPMAVCCLLFFYYGQLLMIFNSSSRDLGQKKLVSTANGEITAK